MLKRCEDCRKLDKSVDIRQSDYMLCDKCENKRKQGSKTKQTKSVSEQKIEANPPAVRKKELSAPTSSRQCEATNRPTLQELFSTPTKLLNVGFSAASSLKYIWWY